MEIHTTRRALLIAAPVLASSAAIPQIAKATAPIDPNWERAKADFAHAVERMLTAQAFYNLKEDEQYAVLRAMGGSKPSMHIVVRDHQFCALKINEEPLASDLLFEELQPGTAKVRGELPGKLLQDEVAAFWQAADAWIAERDRRLEHLGCDEAEVAAHEAYDAFHAQWDRLVATRVSCYPHLSEKIGLAQGHGCMEAVEEASTLVAAIAADLQHIAGGAQ